MYKCCFLACFCANQRIQRLRAELTLAQIREKLPNGWTKFGTHVHTPNKLPLVTKGGTWGVLGGKQFKSLGKLSKGWTDWHQLWFTSADSSGNGLRLNTGMPVLIKLDQMVDSTWQASADLEGGEAPTTVIQLSHEQAISAQSCKQFNSILLI